MGNQTVPFCSITTGGNNRSLLVYRGKKYMLRYTLLEILVKTWLEPAQISQKTLMAELIEARDRSDLNVPESITATLITRIASGQGNGVKKKNDINTLLSHPTAASYMENALGLPGAFNYKTTRELYDRIKQELADRDPSITANHLQPHSVVRDKNNPVQLCRQEEATLDLLRRKLTQVRRPVFAWTAPLACGASFLVRGLQYSPPMPGTNLVESETTGHERPYTPYEQIFYVDPDANGDPLSGAFDDIARKVGLDTFETENINAFFDALSEAKTLVVINGASSLFRGSKAPTTKVIERQLREVWQDRSPVLLLIGSFHTTFQVNETFINFNREMLKHLELPATQYYAFYKQQYVRFARFRDQNVWEDGGARLKRGQWHYDYLSKNDDTFTHTEPTTNTQQDEDLNKQRPPLWPINVRMRAFFASNRENHNYFDPTGGFKKLQGMALDDDQLPEDIYHYKKDLLRKVKDLTTVPARGKGKSEAISITILLRLVSTSKYWLSRDMLELLSADLIKQLPQSKRSDKRDAFEESIADFLAHSDFLASHIPDKDHYVSGLGIKALVQDMWIAEEAGGSTFTRAKAHYEIARYLETKQDNKRELRNEFPFRPHWGRSRAHWLSEAVGHLMRSCETVTFARAQACGRKPILYRSEMPDPPTSELGGCDPYQVLAYCYTHLYKRELNGEGEDRIEGVPLHGTEDNKRNLSKRHGAYLLSTQLIQLMSLGEDTGVPHWALHPSLKHEFCKEAGFALLDIGELKAAKWVFLFGSGSIPEQMDKVESFAPIEPADTPDLKRGIRALTIRRNQIHQCLDRALILTICDDLEAASKYIAKARQGLATAISTIRRMEEPQAEKEKALLSLKPNQIRNRIDIRRAHLLYLRNKLDSAVIRFFLYDHSEKNTDWLLPYDPAADENLKINFDVKRLTHLYGETDFNHIMIATFAKKGMIASTLTGEDAEIDVPSLSNPNASVSDLPAPRENVPFPRNISPQEFSDAAHNLCLKSYSRKSAEGKQHEALGFRVALAHFLRRNMNKPNIAIQILEEAYKDILTYGCSERTYISFLLEAGRTLCDKAQFMRAYATYLHPCICRAATRGFRKEALTACSVASEVLRSIIASANSDALRLRDLSTRDKMLETQRNPAQNINRTYMTYEDPLYGYQSELQDIRRLIKRLGELSFVERRLSLIQELQCLLSSKATEAEISDFMTDQGFLIVENEAAA